MARIRTIKPEFWKHEYLSSLPEPTHMLAAQLLNYADDEGYFNANPELVKAECSPLRSPSVSIRESLASLQAAGYLRLGTGQDGRRYGHVINFNQHQRVDHPSKSKIAVLSITWDEPREVLAKPRENLAPDQGSGIRDQGSLGGAAAQPADVPRLSKLQKVAEPDWMPDFRRLYPKRSGSQRWETARKHAFKRIAEGHTAAEIMAGVERYAAYCVAESIVGRREVQQAATFLGDDKGFLEPWTPSPPKLNGKQQDERQRLVEAEAREWQDLRRRGIEVKFREPREGESLSAYRTLLERFVDEERNGRRQGPQSAASVLPQLARQQ